MSDRLTTRRPSAIRNLPACACRLALGAAALIPALLIGMLSSSTASAAAQR